VLRAIAEATVFALPCIVASDGNRDGLPTVLLGSYGVAYPWFPPVLFGVPEIVGMESTPFG